MVTLGREAHVEPVPGTRFENWDTDEPSERGIDGIERMRLVRDDITAASRIFTLDSKGILCKTHQNMWACGERVGTAPSAATT